MKTPSLGTSPAEPIRTGLAASTLQRAVLDNLLYQQARFHPIATPHDWYMALAYSVRDSGRRSLPGATLPVQRGSRLLTGKWDHGSRRG
jgi:hypothetical protein